MTVTTVDKGWETHPMVWSAPQPIWKLYKQNCARKIQQISSRNIPCKLIFWLSLIPSCSVIISAMQDSELPFSIYC